MPGRLLLAARRALIALLIVAACGGGARQTARGVVIEVEGGLSEITGFLLRLPDGTDLRLRPAEGVLFHDNAPLGHLRDHLRTAEPVFVTYEILDDGSFVAYEVGD